jgi:hypothetical protein
MRITTLLTALVMVACTCNEPEATVAETPSAATTEAKPANPDLAQLQEGAENIALVPSPAEMQKALSSAGIEARLSDLVADRDLKMNVPNKDQVAVRTGVVLADMLLTVRHAEKEKLIAQFGQIKVGMAELGAGTDIAATIDDIVGRLVNDGVSRDELVKELDELSGAIIPEVEYEAGDWAVPLIQAGSWLEGSNLVATALRSAGKYDKATDLLKQPAVIDYFLKYVRTEGADKAPSQVVAQLEATLMTLKAICEKPVLGEEDVLTIQSATTSVLDML